MRHVARMPDHAHRFVNYLYRYRCLSQLLIAPIEARRGMLHAMRQKAVFRTCGCPKTPFWRKLAFCRSLSDIGSASSTSTSTSTSTSSAKSPRLNEQNKYQQHANFPRESETCLTAQLRRKRLHECIGDADLPGDRQRKIGATGRQRGLCWMEALSSRGF